MATSTSSGDPIVNLVTSGSTSTNTRGITSITTPKGTNLSIINMKIPFQKRVIQGSKRFLFFLAEQPDYLPNVGQKVLIHHTNLPTSSAINNYFVDKSTNVGVGSFVRLALMTNTATAAARDGFTYALDVTYDDDTLGYVAGDCSGMIEYDVSPLNYDILKPIESNVIVTERVPYDQSEGDNYLLATSSGLTQAITNIVPMLFVDRGDSNTVFSNLFKSFNLPITDTELKEFEQTTLGTFTESSAGTLYYNGKKGNWAAGGAGPFITHPVTGYTGTFFATAFESLALAGSVNKRVLVMEIPQTQYGEIIDGKSLKVKIPKSGGGSFYTAYGAYKTNPTEYDLGKMDNYMSEHDFSASYFGTPAVLTSTTYESNVVLLFCDDIATPNSGGSWATGHDEVMQGEKVYNSTSVVKKKFFDFYEDTPVGIAYLDKGFILITNPQIVDEAYTDYYASASYINTEIAANIIVNYDLNIDYNNSQFLYSTSYISSSEILVEFLSYNTEKSINVVCLASANEFYRTTNITAKVLDNALDADFAEFKNPVSGNLYPIVITEIGLHDAQGNLLAIIKPTEPIKKYWYDVTSFNIKIRL